MEARHISIWIGIVRNNQIRKDRKGVSTTADNPYDFDRMINRASLDEINQISLVKSMSGVRMRAQQTRQDSISWRNPAIKESNSNLEEDFIRINL